MHRLHEQQMAATISPDGRVLFFSAERFAIDICEGTCCFHLRCCAWDEDVQRRAHPARLGLRRYKLHGRTIILPNGRTHQYGTYTIPCCQSCNSVLSKELETPLSKVIGDGHAAVADYLEKEGPLRLFAWMALVFLKIHLKDATLREHANFNAGDEVTADARRL